MVDVARVLNDRKGFHVGDLDAETRTDLLGEIVDAIAVRYEPTYEAGALRSEALGILDGLHDSFKPIDDHADARLREIINLLAVVPPTT